LFFFFILFIDCFIVNIFCQDNNEELEFDINSFTPKDQRRFYKCVNFYFFIFYLVLCCLTIWNKSKNFAAFQFNF
jgi:hypothetical protein